MMPWRSLLFLSLVLFLSGLPLSVGVAVAQDLPASPDLSTVTTSPNDCEFLLHGSDDPRPQLGDIACGTLDVPEDWSHAEGRRIQIGYLILKSTAAQPQPDPVVFLAGGPGSSPLTLAAIWAPFFAGLRQERDVVFFDQRGTRLSSPLRCEAYTRIMALDLPPAKEESGGAGTPVPPAYPSELITPDQSLQQAEVKYGPIADACVQQITATGADLSQYTTPSSANDVVALVKTLGYDEYNLYGISYGTRLALEVMRNHPASGLRSVVLDSTVPPEVKSYERLSVGPHEAVIQLFADCERDPTCNTVYPDLEARFIALLARLRSQPVIADDGTTISDRQVVNVMQSLTARVEIAPYLPLMISELARGEDQTYRGIVSGSLATATYTPAAVATPETAGAATSAVVAAELSPARRFVLDLQARYEALPGHEAGQFVPELNDLDTQMHDRQALQDFVDRVIPQSDQSDAHTALRSALGALTDSEVEEVFAVVEQAITLNDYQIAGQTVPQYYSIECNERAPYQSFANTVANAQQAAIPDLALGMSEEIVKVFAVCERWPSERAPEAQTQPVWSEIPTLVLAGAYDNLTPVSWNKSAFETLPNGVFVLGPMSAHGVITYSACADRIAQAFITDPTVSPDTSCLADLQPPWVLPPAGAAPNGEQATPTG